jgi:Flp pilus assembly protein CpaB
VQTESSTTNGYALRDTRIPLGMSPDDAVRRHGRRLNIRLVAGVLVGAVAFVGFLVFSVSTMPSTRYVLVATHDLPAGGALHRSDVAVARVQLGDAQAHIAVSPDSIDDLEGRELAAPVFAKQVLIQPQLAAAGRRGLEPGFIKVSVPVRPDNAVGDQLRAGDAVAVLVTRDKGKPTSETHIVLPRAWVDQVGPGDAPPGPATGSSLGGQVDASGPTSRIARPVNWLVLVIAQEQVTTLSQARWNGDVEVVLLPRALEAASGDAK